MYHHDSYKKHENWYNAHFPTIEDKVAYLKKNDHKAQTINNWLQNIFYNCITPLLGKADQKWLTVGDAYGFDAQYIQQFNPNQYAEASDLNSDFLEIASQNGIINHYSVQNAENLTFQDNTFDYILCKETYHHFPRPYAALYEMIRVAKKGIVIIEPQDPITKMPVLLGLLNLLAKTSPSSIKKLWRNQFSYEPVGNFVYKVSEREFEKFAAGLGLPMVAFKQVNPNFYKKALDGLPAVKTEKHFRDINRKKKVLDTLVKMTVIPGQVLSAIVFKEQPDPQLLAELKALNYRIVSIPKNPYV
ncbi:class I SAM-dependent methyltransferase [Pedobacter sp. PAMC26386]|nr:class I SAM-dependent methyltransferase [Pedobacter sp. PAMC26386]